MKESCDNFTTINLNGKKENSTKSLILYKQVVKGKAMEGGGLGLWSDVTPDNI